MPINDNDPAIPQAKAPSSDAHGIAALMLVESLIHGLCENSTLSSEQAVEIAETAIEVQHEKAEADATDGQGEPRRDSSQWQAHALLSSIGASLQMDADKPIRPGSV